MTDRAQRLNLLRRLLLIGLAAFATWLIVVWPLMYANSIARDRDSYDRAIEREFANSHCLIYQTAPYETLKVPTYGDACWHIYMSRGSKSAVPFTLEAYRKRNAEWDRDRHLKAMAFGTALAVVISALAYFLLWVLAGEKASSMKDAFSSVRARAKRGALMDRIGWITFNAVCWLAATWSLGIPFLFFPREYANVTYYVGTFGLLLVAWAIFVWLKRRHSPLIISSDA